MTLEKIGKRIQFRRNLETTIREKKDISPILEANQDETIEYRNDATHTPLFVAAQHGNIEAINLLLARGADVDTPQYSNYYTPLMIAISRNHEEAATLLLDNRADVHRHTSYDQTALFLAARNGNVTLIEKLLTKGAKVNQCNNQQETPLFVAASNGHVEAIELLLKHEAQVDILNRKKTSPLLVATQNNHVDAIELLASKGQINVPNKKGETPLLVAAGNGNFAAVKTLIKNKAIVNIHNKDGETPLLLAAQNNNVEIVTELLENNASVHIRNYHHTPLTAAAQNGNVDIIKRLLAAGAKVDFTNKANITPLFVAACNGKVEALKILTAHGADIEAPETNGTTPVCAAPYSPNGHNALIFLVSEGADTQKLPTQYHQLKLRGEKEYAQKKVHEKKITQCMDTLLSDLFPKKKRAIKETQIGIAEEDTGTNIGEYVAQHMHDCFNSSSPRFTFSFKSNTDHDSIKHAKLRKLMPDPNQFQHALNVLKEYKEQILEKIKTGDITVTGHFKSKMIDVLDQEPLPENTISASSTTKIAPDNFLRK